MSIKNYYASIVVVEIQDSELINIESISITMGECVLSGAWTLFQSERETVLNIISNRLIIVLGDTEKFQNYISVPNLVYIEADPFLREANIAASEALKAYELFKAENPKRKKMVAPNFHIWPEKVDFNNASAYLESVGRVATPINTPGSMKAVLAASNLVKYLVDKWQLDEQERNNRKYVEGDDAEITILPKTWLLQSESI